MIEMRIETTKATEEWLKRAPIIARKALFEAMKSKVGPFLERTVKRSFGADPYPMVRTGTLRRSIYNKAIERSAGVIGIVGTSVIYGKFLEEGTSKMKAKPFLRPAIERNEEMIAAIITNTMATRMEK